MSDGKWSGGIANHSWARPGSRYYRETLTAADRHELYLSVAGESFYCEACGGHHPLSEHRACRNPQAVGKPVDIAETISRAISRTPRQ